MLRSPVGRPLCTLGRRPLTRLFSAVKPGDVGAERGNHPARLKTGNEPKGTVNVQKREGNSDINYLRTGGPSLAARLAQKLQGPLSPEEQAPQSQSTRRPPNPKPKAAQPHSPRNSGSRHANSSQNYRVPVQAEKLEAESPKQRPGKDNKRFRQPPRTVQNNLAMQHADLPLPMTPPATTGTASDPNREGDITFDIIESGGEHPEPPMLTIPELPSTDLKDIFGKVPRGLQPASHRIKGDYSLYTQPAPDFAVTPGKLDTISQANLAMAHQKGIHLTQRSLVSQIIRTSIKT